jgi:hypothetical protein
VIAKLQEKAAIKAADDTCPIFEQQQADEFLNETELAAKDLDKYQSHLA